MNAKRWFAVKLYTWDTFLHLVSFTLLISNLFLQSSFWAKEYSKGLLLHRTFCGPWFCVRSCAKFLIIPFASILIKSHFTIEKTKSMPLITVAYNWKHLSFFCKYLDLLSFYIWLQLFLLKILRRRIYIDICYHVPNIDIHIFLGMGSIFSYVDKTCCRAQGTLANIPWWLYG